jgi:hypothetical protein
MPSLPNPTSEDMLATINKLRKEDQIALMVGMMRAAYPEFIQTVWVQKWITQNAGLISELTAVSKVRDDSPKSKWKSVWGHKDRDVKRRVLQHTLDLTRDVAVATVLNIDPVLQRRAAELLPKLELVVKNY